MIIKLSKVISCSSEHPQYPVSNLLEYPAKSSWRCAKQNELAATVVLQLAESSTITGLEVGNYRSCIVVVEASSFSEPDKWLPIVNHQFLSHDEATNNKFKDQVQLFTKRDLNIEIINKKFDRVKVTCMQAANPRELFGLEFIVLKTEVVVDLGLDVFGRFKLKEKNNDDAYEFKEKYLKLFNQKKNYKDELKEKMNNFGANKFAKKKEENCKPKNKQILKKFEASAKLNNSEIGLSNDSSNLCLEATLIPVKRTLFGDVIPHLKQKGKNSVAIPNKRPHSPHSSSSINIVPTKKVHCDICNLNTDQLCSTCNLLYQPKQKIENTKKSLTRIKAKPKKEFCKLFEDVSFALSGYVNPQRDEIRRKALKMGAKYIANLNSTNDKCTHLICAFQITPKSQQLKGHCKIVNHKFINDCYDRKKRIPWRQYALDKNDQNQPESEEEIEGSDVPIIQQNIYDQETDESDCN